LSLRNLYPPLFTLGDYTPLESSGLRGGNVVAFARRHSRQAVIVLAPRLVHHAVATDTLLSDTYWGDTTIELPAGIRPARDILGVGEFGPASRLVVADIFRKQPFALLLAEIE
jgi:(1->4)-alpha-D-glucan 1-alpha-D-glucosylmutase